MKYIIAIIQWVKQFGTAGKEINGGFDLADDGYIYSTIYSTGSLDGISSYGGNDVIIYKLDSDGNIQ